MNKPAFRTSKQATWRNHLARHGARGKSIAAFCRDKASSQANVHIWRTKLANGANERATVPAPISPLIDLGAVNSATASTASEHSSTSTPIQAPPAMPGIDIRIDLGGGVVLTITRR